MWAGRLAWAGDICPPAPAMPPPPLAKIPSDPRALCNRHAQVQVHFLRANTSHVRRLRSSHHCACAMQSASSQQANVWEAFSREGHFLTLGSQSCTACLRGDSL